MDFFERSYGAPVVDHFLINLDKPDSWELGSPMRKWVDGQRGKGRRGTVKFYDSDALKVKEEMKDWKLDQSKDPVVQKHEATMLSMKKEHLRRNIRPVIAWEQDGANAWKGLGGPRKENGARIWDEWYYVAALAKNDPTNKNPFTATYENKEGVFELGQYSSFGEAIRVCNRANALKHRDRAQTLKV